MQTVPDTNGQVIDEALLVKRAGRADEEMNNLCRYDTCRTVALAHRNHETIRPILDQVEALLEGEVLAELGEHIDWTKTAPDAEPTAEQVLHCAADIVVQRDKFRTLLAEDRTHPLPMLAGQLAGLMHSLAKAVVSLAGQNEQGDIEPRLRIIERGLEARQELLRLEIKRIAAAAKSIVPVMDVQKTAAASAANGNGTHAPLFRKQRTSQPRSVPEPSNGTPTSSRMLHAAMEEQWKDVVNPLMREKTLAMLHAESRQGPVARKELAKLILESDHVQQWIWEHVPSLREMMKRNDFDATDIGSTGKHDVMTGLADALRLEPGARQRFAAGQARGNDEETVVYAGVIERLLAETCPLPDVVALIARIEAGDHAEFALQMRSRKKATKKPSAKAVEQELAGDSPDVVTVDSSAVAEDTDE